MKNLQLCNETALGFGAAEDSSVGAVKIADVRLELLAKHMDSTGDVLGIALARCKISDADR